MQQILKAMKILQIRLSTPVRMKKQWQLNIESISKEQIENIYLKWVVLVLFQA
jgi:hypothetical protein